MTTTERDESIVPAEPIFAAETLADELDEHWWDDAVMLGGWQMGATAFAEHASLQELVARLAALQHRALALDLERAGAGDAIERRAALAAASRVCDAAALLQGAAVQAFSLAALRALEGRAREVRHEMKNPIGTIRNALTMLTEDSAAPAGGDRSGDSRQLHAIALRGTTLLETLVRDRLGGANAAEALLGGAVPADDVVGRVLRALAARASASGVQLSAGKTAPAASVRPGHPGLELVLRSLVVAAARSAVAGESVRVDIDAVPGARIRFVVRADQLSRPVPDLSDAARELAALAGIALSGRLDADGACVEVAGEEGSARQ